MIDIDDDQALLEASKAKLADREWRLDNLYQIRSEEGRAIRFRRNDVQRSFDKSMWYRNVIPKARKLGLSTYIAIFILDECIINSGTVCGITDQTLTDAEDKLAMIRFAYEGIPETLKSQRSLIRANDTYLEWANGSSVSVGLTYRGGTPKILHVSEYGKVAVENPSQAREIKTGAIQAVPANGFVFIESTAHGTNGEFCDMVRAAEAKRIRGAKLTHLDFQSHFYGWMHKREYRVPNNLVLITRELREYFEDIRIKHGIALDADQMAWYAKKHEELGPDDIKQEFPSHPDELFYASLEGAYWKRELTKARAEGRIGESVPHDPSRRVNTFWDIGEDCTAIVFHQTDGVRHRIIDYYEEEGGSIQSACAVVDEKRRERGFVYSEHYFPHDLDRRLWDVNAISRKKIAEELLGKPVTIVPRVADKADSIEAARRMIALTWFDATHAGRLVECLENYRKKWNDRMGLFTPEPVHDWSSHGSDAFQQGAMGLRPEKVEKRREGRHSLEQRPRVTAWSA